MRLFKRRAIIVKFRPAHGEQQESLLYYSAWNFPLLTYPNFKQLVYNVLSNALQRLLTSKPRHLSLYVYKKSPRVCPDLE